MLFEKIIKNEDNEDFLYDFYEEICYCENALSVIDNMIKMKINLKYLDFLLNKQIYQKLNKLQE